jgi:flagellar biosynthesis/type III secretory pathway M-ring protein FliF/YscJ
MRLLTKAVLLFIAMLFVVSTFSLVGCTSRPNAQQLQALEEQKNAALAAENTLEERRREKSRLESQLNQKRKELQDAKTELEEVKKRLGQ